MEISPFRKISPLGKIRRENYPTKKSHPVGKFLSRKNPQATNDKNTKVVFLFFYIYKAKDTHLRVNKQMLNL